MTRKYPEFLLGIKFANKIIIIQLVTATTTKKQSKGHKNFGVRNSKNIFKYSPVPRGLITEVGW